MKKCFVLGSKGKTGSFVSKLIHSSYSNVFTLTDSIETSDVVIEFSNPEACLLNIQKTNLSVVWVIASTGWTQNQESELETLSKGRLVLKSSNFSLGIFELGAWLTQSAPKLSKLGFRVSMSETHHTHKKDSPSGTALKLKNMIEHQGFEDFPIESIREGDVVGTHTVRFESSGEVLILEHQAKDRSVFAQGAIEVAKWLIELKTVTPSKTGLLSLADFAHTI